jgi:hypothetical protein
MGPANQGIRDESRPEQFAYCCRRYWLARVTKLQLKNDLRGHQSAFNAVIMTAEEHPFQRRAQLVSMPEICHWVNWAGFADYSGKS